MRGVAFSFNIFPFTFAESGAVRMQVVWQDQSSQDETLQDTADDYLDAFSGEESNIGEQSSDWSDNESLVELQNYSAVGADHKVIPILILDHIKEHKEQKESKSDVYVQIQTAVKNFSGCRRKIPKTPIPGYSDPLAEILQSKLQSNFENFEFERQKGQVQNHSLHLANSSLLKKRGTRHGYIICCLSILHFPPSIIS